ncbi:serine/threonine-protein phosphatase 4 regulatory subunit 4-like isoform X2 [Ischnura elegans]|uniref:serine/threonine-protein phosphatase 4 regulatory subunit 4-like isoform X2 n=1 Tax=Ischnura elegans TaxID=197161 RepID=UPI001ED87814|nr:serine/threonine-protein phosphatase 4 regulatory subunit 4-like isoform X2 [Ischnura elegans]
MWVTEGRRNRDTPLEAGEALCEPVGEDVQQLDVVQSLPLLLRGDDAEQCMQQVVPHVQQALPTSSMEIQIAASNTFLSILEKELVHPTTFTQTFLQSILSSIDSTDPVVANAWLETLLDSIDLLPAEIVRKEILHIAVAKGQLSQPVSSRLACCKLIGKMATKFESFLIKKELLPVVQSLFQDVSPEVRSCLCSQLGWVARGLGPELAPSTLLPPLVELANDEEVMVRLAAVHSVVDLLGIVDEETCKQTIIPLVKKICENALHTEDAVLATISYQLGKLCLGLSAYLTVEEKEWFIDFFQQLALLGVSHLSQNENIHLKPMPDVVPVLQENADMYVEIRRHCAYNIPAMFLFASSRDDFHTRLYPTFCDLVCDPHVHVRRTVAGGVHEVARLLGPSNRMLKNELVHLLCDETQEVLSAIVPNLTTILLLMTKFKNIGPESLGTTVVEIGRALLKCEETISSTTNWRLHASFLSQMECLPQCLPIDYIQSHLVPVLFLRIHKARPLPCRVAAVQTLLIYLRYSVKQKDHLLSKIKTEIGHAHSCHLRMLYMEMCSMALKIFSASYFKNNFFSGVLEAGDDPVPNIRLKVCHMLPHLKGVLIISPDKKLLKALETCIQSLMLKESDRDVCSALTVVIDRLDAMDKNAEVLPPESAEEDKQKLDEEEKLERILGDKKGIGSLVPSKSGPPLMEKISKGIPYPKSISGKESKAQLISKSGSAIKSSPLAPSNTSLRQIRAEDGGDRKTPPTSKIPGNAYVRKSITSIDLKSQKSAVTNLSAPSPASDYSSSVGPDNVDPSADEFYIDAGVRIQTTMSNRASPAPVSTRIPLRDLLFSSRKQHSLEDYQLIVGVNSVCPSSSMHSERSHLSSHSSPHLHSLYRIGGNMLGNIKRGNAVGQPGSTSIEKQGVGSAHKTRMVVASCSDLPTPSQPYIFPIKNTGEDIGGHHCEASHTSPRKVYTANKRLQSCTEGSKSALDRTNNDIKSSGTLSGTTTTAGLQSFQLNKQRYGRTSSWTNSPQRGSPAGASHSMRPQSCILPRSGEPSITSPYRGLRYSSRSLSQEELRHGGGMKQQPGLQRGSTVSGPIGRRISSAFIKSNIPPLPSGRVPRRTSAGSAHSSPGSSRASSPGSRLQGTSGYSGGIQSLRHAGSGSSLLVRALPTVKKQQSAPGGMGGDVVAAHPVESPDKRINGGVRGRQRQRIGSAVPRDDGSAEGVGRRWTPKQENSEDAPNWRRKSADGSALIASGGRRTSPRPLSVGGVINSSTSRLPVPTLRKS